MLANCAARATRYMPIAVEAVPPAQFAAWVVAKGGTHAGAGSALRPAIPQPGADRHRAAQTPATAADNATGPTENATAAAPAHHSGRDRQPRRRRQRGQ